MVPAEDDRGRSVRRHLPDLLVDHAERTLGAGGNHRRVAGIDHGEVRVRLGVELDRPRRIARPRGRGHPDRTRAEPRAGSRRHALIEWRPDDRDIGPRFREGSVVGGPGELLEGAAPVRVVGQIDRGEFDELVVAAKFAVLQPEVRRIAHGGSASHTPGAGRPPICCPEPNTSRRARVITETDPAPSTRQPPSTNRAAVRSSTQSRITSSCGAASSDGPTQRCPNVSKWGTTAMPGTSPSAGRYRRRSSPGIRSRINVHPPNAIAPADDPASAAPSRHASTIASHDAVPASTFGTRPGSPPTR